MRGRGAATDERGAVDDLEFDFAAWDFGCEFAEEIFGAALDVIRGGANHAERGDFVVGGAEIGTDRAHNMIQRLIDEAARAEFKVVIDRTFPFEEAPAAYRYQLSGTFIGKVVIRL